MTTPNMPSGMISREYIRVAGGFEASEEGNSPAGGLDIDNAGNLATDGDITAKGEIDIQGGEISNSTGSISLNATSDTVDTTITLKNPDVNHVANVEVEGHLEVGSGATIDGTTTSNAYAAGGSSAEGTFISSPGGGRYRSVTAYETGWIRIDFPDGLSSYNAMFTMHIAMHNWRDGKSFDLFVGGSPFSSWTYASANLVCEVPVSTKIRFGFNGARPCIYIGESTSVWVYPQIVIRDVHVGYQSYAAEDWQDGWGISITTTDMTTVNKTFSDIWSSPWSSDKTTATLDQDGEITGDLDVGGVIKVDGTQVLGNQQSAIADASGDLTAVTATVNAILAAMRSHGEIAT